jgi:hypothetical protein
MIYIVRAISEFSEALRNFGRTPAYRAGVTVQSEFSSR